MSEKQGNQRRESKHPRVWDVLDAENRFRELLAAAATSGPQQIMDGHRRFALTLVRAKDSPQGKRLLSEGGPLEGDEFPG